jgi:hypothetical protein
MLYLLREVWSEWQDLNLRPPRPERGAVHEHLRKVGIFRVLRPRLFFLWSAHLWGYRGGSQKRSHYDPLSGSSCASHCQRLVAIHGEGQAVVLAAHSCQRVQGSSQLSAVRLAGDIKAKMDMSLDELLASIRQEWAKLGPPKRSPRRAFSDTGPRPWPTGGRSRAAPRPFAYRPPALAHARPARRRQPKRKRISSMRYQLRVCSTQSPGNSAPQ